MHYTIATMKDVHGKIEVDFNINGNQYQVGIYEADTKNYKHRTYRTQAEAYAIFERLANAIITGCYSLDERLAMLSEY